MAPSRSFGFALALVSLSVSLVACGASSGDDCVGTDGACDRSADSFVAKPHPFLFGVEGWSGDAPFYAAFRAAAGASSATKLCHVYTYWNIARANAPGHTLSALEDWFDAKVGHCDEVLVTFKGAGDGDIPAIHPGTSHDFRDAFLAFVELTAPGKRLAHWKGKLSFTAWNEPNNHDGGGDGLGVVIPPDDAARLYMVVREHCDPSDCKVAAGDFATNGHMDDAIAWNCANDNLDGADWCKKKSPFNHDNAGPSYLDVYKHTIAMEAHTKHHLREGFRPEYFAYHPWNEVNEYVQHDKKCDTYESCSTRRLLQSLGGSWGGVEIWDDEVGVGSQADAPLPHSWSEPCGAAFLVRLTDLSPRITRLYYMWFGQSEGRLVDASMTLNDAGKVLARHETSYSKVCPDTGMPIGK